MGEVVGCEEDVHSGAPLPAGLVGKGGPWCGQHHLFYINT